MAHTWLAPPMEMDLKGWSVPTCSQELPWNITTQLARAAFGKEREWRRSSRRVLTEGSWGLAPRRHNTSPFSLMAQTGTCSIWLWARQGIREMSLRRRGGTCRHGPRSVILHFLWAETHHMSISAPGRDHVAACVRLPRPSSASHKVLHGFVSVESSDGQNKDPCYTSSLLRC